MGILYRHKAKTITIGIFCMVFIFGYRIIGLYEYNKAEHLARYDERFHHAHSHQKNINNEDLLLPILNENPVNKPFVYKPNNMPYNKNLNQNQNLKIDRPIQSVKQFAGIDPIVRIDDKQKLIDKLPNPKETTTDGLLASLQRIVHIDLKGAPPKASYFEKFIPFLKQNGAHGILLEYEDMFPFEGQLKEARHGLAYTLKEVELINKLAKENGLYIIPLVQTYGHLEWLLKVKKFAHLREHSEFPQVITPCLEESYTVLYGNDVEFNIFECTFKKFNQTI